ncbi:hypothetical protein EKH57_17190 [Halorubrum sp. BOL3-1]|uniref:hypothetical protein n=1 Tax=Halorubrum sp. BOL3-1 TaxID=2497325 RepID=UPI00100501CC|nr:hypothetical protein [Halorubrum sp. BOL3-1]QAU14256.1 hypothetical protein EKH57_17190 [Halorubrum sp. BOL3-1]
MMKAKLLAFVRKPFGALDDVTSDETTRQSTYSGVRTSQDGLYAITSTQPGTGVYAATDGMETDSQTVESADSSSERYSQIVAGKTYDCVDPATCATC